jgi:hypothetical protein
MSKSKTTPKKPVTYDFEGFSLPRPPAPPKVPLPGHGTGLPQAPYWMPNIPIYSRVFGHRDAGSTALTRMLARLRLRRLD